MKTAIVVALCVAALGLTGCYESKMLLLDPSAAIQPLAGGDYGPVEDRRRIVPRADGWYDEYKWRPEVGEAGEWGPPRSILLNELGDVDGRSTYAVALPVPEGSWLYGVVALTEDGGFIQAHPDCMLGEDYGIARRNGASETGESAICHFTDSDALIAALSEWSESVRDLRKY